MKSNRICSSPGDQLMGGKSLFELTTFVMQLFLAPFSRWQQLMAVQSPFPRRII